VFGSSLSPVLREIIGPHAEVKVTDGDFSRFRGRPHIDADPARVAPGQYITNDFPVLSAGPTPHHPLDWWSFTIYGAVDEPRSWSWQEFQALPSETVKVDIHCVTKWSKLDTVWTGVSLDTVGRHRNERGLRAGLKRW
jgi:DMSO/TMAO reductase YedYZ molybdopterin-dependent catalytic subunit